MRFLADFHVHSKFSRATAKNLDLEHLYIAAQQKGITVVGTGDFTHPAWFSEIKEKLVPAEQGLFRLKDEIAHVCDNAVPASCRGDVRFILVSEISNIYKKNGKTRKNHNLVFAPDIDSATRFNTKLDAIGNITSDGRPILGLDARDLLEVLLESSDQAFLIPAHIWTPWFSLLGSKSGFDSIEECFEDLSHHIFALETGLSSDPAMNRRVSGLDGFTLVSNSDAHSPSKLGREANLFDVKLDYRAIKSAMETGNPEQFLGTFEFYPEEGKYHLDGHRKCDIRMWPKDSIEHGGICPVCGKPLTLGVLYRVEELADRGESAVPERIHPFYSIIPLEEILSEIFKVGPKSKKVQRGFQSVLEKLGPEFSILHSLSIEAIDKAGIPLLGEAVKRVREKNIQIYPGYDGEFGKIEIFTREEIDTLLGQQSLFIMPGSDGSGGKTGKQKANTLKKNTTNNIPQAQLQRDNADFDRKPDSEKPGIEIMDQLLDSLNDEQIKAVRHAGSPLLIVAGPGTGKTLTLTRKIAYLVNRKGVPPENILAVTFTNKAAQEMRERLDMLLDGSASVPFVATFHALCLHILKEINGDVVSNRPAFSIIDDYDRKFLVAEAARKVEQKGIPVSVSAKVLLEKIIAAKQQIYGPEDDLEGIAASDCEPAMFAAVYRTYQDILAIQGLVDFEDLILNVVKIFENDGDIGEKYRRRFSYMFVDEYQDLNHGQYRIVKALALRDSEICVIGDPDQSIYGFRGSDVTCFNRFVEDYPKATVITLKQNYRSTETILEASYQVIKEQSDTFSYFRIYSDIQGVKTIGIMKTATEKAEAVAVGKTIEKMVGGIGYHSIDYGRAGYTDPLKDKSFSAFAVLFRTAAQGMVFAETFSSAGIPYQMVSRENRYQRKGICELIAFFKVIEKTGSFADFDRIAGFLKTGVGNKTMDIFKEWCYNNSYSLKDALACTRRFPIEQLGNHRQLKLDEIIGLIFRLKVAVADMNVEEKLAYLVENIAGLKSVIKSSAETEDVFHHLIRISGQFSTASDFIDMIDLQTDTDTYNMRSEKVSLMTMHAAKGLEFPVVFVAGCEDDFIPYKTGGQKNRFAGNNSDINEEKRLLYVAMTRAKEHLFLTYANKRRIYGKTVLRKISPFVDDIDRQLKRYEDTLKQTKVKKKTYIQLELF